MQYFQNFAHPMCEVDDPAISNIKSYPIALYPLKEDYEEVVNSELEGFDDEKTKALTSDNALKGYENIGWTSYTPQCFSFRDLEKFSANIIQKLTTDNIIKNCGINIAFKDILYATNIKLLKIDMSDVRKINVLINDDILKFYQKGYYNASDLEKFDIKVIKVLIDPVMFKCYQNDHYSPSNVLHDVGNDNEMAEYYLSKCQDVADYTFDQ